MNRKSPQFSERKQRSPKEHLGLCFTSELGKCLGLLDYFFSLFRFGFLFHSCILWAEIPLLAITHKPKSLQVIDLRIFAHIPKRDRMGPGKSGFWSLTRSKQALAKKTTFHQTFLRVPCGSLFHENGLIRVLMNALFACQPTQIALAKENPWKYLLACLGNNLHKPA